MADAFPRLHHVVKTCGPIVAVLTKLSHWTRKATSHRVSLHPPLQPHTSLCSFRANYGKGVELLSKLKSIFRGKHMFYWTQ